MTIRKRTVMPIDVGALGRRPAAIGRLLGVLCAIVGVGALAPTALAASPTLTTTCSPFYGCETNGSGFTPSGKVHVQAYAGTAFVASYYLTASAPTLVCVQGLKPHCQAVGGGTFTAAPPVDFSLACGATAGGTVTYTDVSTGLSASEPETWHGVCPE